VISRSIDLDGAFVFVTVRQSANPRHENDFHVHDYQLPRCLILEKVPSFPEKVADSEIVDRLTREQFTHALRPTNCGDWR
jgi:hypothetical protein